MSQRPSGYERVENDIYLTPAWVVECLIPHIPKRIIRVFDPACGTGNIVNAITSKTTLDATGKDLSHGYDYLKDKSWHEAIIANPPFKFAEEFIAHAITHSTYVAMLLRCDWHHAKTRQYLFKDCSEFSKIIALTERIVFIQRTDGKKAAPSFNHSWFIWDHAREQSAPTIAWAP